MTRASWPSLRASEKRRHCPSNGSPHACRWARPRALGPCCIVGCNTMRNHHANNSSSNLWFDPFLLGRGLANNQGQVPCPTRERSPHKCLVLSDLKPAPPPSPARGIG